MKKSHCIFYSVLLFTFFCSAQTNIDFEATPAGAYTSANAVSGWTISSQTNSSTPPSTVWTLGSSEFSIVSTPISSFPFLGNILHSPLGGTQVARLNNSTANYSSTKLTRDYFVTSSNTLFQYAYAGVWEEDVTLPWYGPSFVFRIKNLSGAELSCQSLTMSPVVGGSSTGVNFSVAAQSSTNQAVWWTNWQVKSVDLSPFINTTITIEIISSDCHFGDHYGTVFFDAKSTNNPSGVNFCPGSGTAAIVAPSGYYHYQWYAPLTGTVWPPTGTLQTLYINNPVSGSIYSLQTITDRGCVFMSTYTIATSTTSIVSLISQSTCLGGNGGAATVQATGSGTGYTYTWTNSSNSVVSSSSVLSNAPPGTYSIAVSGLGSSLCGVANSTVSITTGTAGVTSLIRPFCGNEAYLNAPGGNNYQWYSNSIPNTFSFTSFTVNAPVNGAKYQLAYTSPYGCYDSLQFTLLQTVPGNLNILSNATVCPGSTNGSVVLSVAPSFGSLLGTNSFSVFSVGLTPPYVSSISPTTSHSFTAANLSAGSIYSVIVSDGACKYTTNFTVPVLSFDYTLSTSSSPTVCSGNSIQVSTTFSSPPAPGQYTYSWSPSSFLFGGTAQNAIITPSVNVGSTLLLTYSTIVTPTLVNCPLTKTLSITVANPLTPTISSIPQLCSNAPSYSIAVNPGGGTFINGSGSAIGTSSGILTPSLASAGVNTFTYVNSIGPCIAQSSAFYVVKSPPGISIAGNTLICGGESVTLLASGANSYTWSNTVINPFITVTPSLTIVYGVEGKDALTNCSNTNTILVTVEHAPIMTVVGNTLLCSGETATLMAYGASTYSWSNGFSSPSVIISPYITTTYTLTGTSALASCSNTQTVTVTVEICDHITITEGNIAKNVIAYPNPSSGKFFMDAEDILSFEVVDGLGKIILEEHFQKDNYSLDLSKYPNGIYTLKLFQSNQIKTLKLIKTN